MMWTARIALLSTGLLTLGGWFDPLLPKRKKRALLLLCPVILGLTAVPTFETPSVRLCFAPCAFFLCTAILCPTDQPFSALVTALLGGFLGWKLIDTVPLFPEPGLFIALPALLLGALYCRDINAKALAIVAAPFVMLFFQMIGDYTLFQSAVLELGNADALTAQTVGSALVLAVTLLENRFGTVLRRLHASA